MRLTPGLPVALLTALLISSCGPAPGTRSSKLYPAGEKATVGSLTYTVVDSQTLPHLGDDPANPRVPQHRFFLVQLSVSNGGSADSPIPAMTLVDEAGKTYPELSDGAGVPQWLGVVRRVGPGGTERGNVAFDAPATHMHLKLTDETDEGDILVDLPLSFAHEQLNENSSVPPPVAGPQQMTAPPAAPKTK